MAERNGSVTSKSNPPYSSLSSPSPPRLSSKSSPPSQNGKGEGHSGHDPEGARLEEGQKHRKVWKNEDRAEQEALLVVHEKRGVFRTSSSLSSLSFLSPSSVVKKNSQISLARQGSKMNMEKSFKNSSKNSLRETILNINERQVSDSFNSIDAAFFEHDTSVPQVLEGTSSSVAEDAVSSSSESEMARLVPASSSSALSQHSLGTMAASSINATPPCSPTTVRTGTRYKLITESDVQVCRLNHTKTVVSKIMNSRYLRRWECHHLMLGNSEIWSTTPAGFMEHGIAYSSIQDINVISRWDAGHKFCIRITITDGSVLLQATNSYLRDQWLHSIQWKRYISKYDKLLRNTKRLDVLTKEIKQLIDLSLSTPIQDDSVNQFPLELVSLLLKENADMINHVAYEQIIVALAPLLEKNHPTQQMCEFFTKHCKNSPRSQVTLELFTPVIHRILKHNVDFGRYLRMQVFIQEYVQALSSQNNGAEIVNEFIRSLHGPASLCPHPRVLPNLVAVCLSTVYSYSEDRKLRWSSITSRNDGQSGLVEEEQDRKLVTYINILHTMSEFEDWRLQLAIILQPIPFPDDALAHDLFTRSLKPLVQNIATDTRCDVHTTLLGMRDGKAGWFDLYCPGGITCDDEGLLYSGMLKRLITCCCKRKKFFNNHLKMIGPWQLMAIRENEAAIEALCMVLEFEVCESEDSKLQIVATLQSTNLGKKVYNELCQRQIQLQEIQQKGGPRKLTLPSRSTDDDLRRMLSSGSFGNLECLSLAFTQVTSACALDLIKLPSLRYLNLWSTQFGDTGLQVISEYMPKLQVLNLCETPVTDKGLSCLSAMCNLRRLNLNSTHLSAPTFQELKEKLPSLKECDVRYTDAW